MARYLAIDFGTSNCLAGEIGEDRRLHLVPLEQQAAEMPSSIFLKGRTSSGVNFSEERFKRKVAEAVNSDNKKIENAKLELRKRLQDFEKINQPRCMESGTYYSPADIRKYHLVEPDLFPAAVRDFRSTKLAHERKRLLALIPKERPISVIESEIRVQMYQEILESDQEILIEETFFTALLNPANTPLFGRAAVDQYSKNPSSGFFMSSPKSFLAVSLNDSQKELFTKVISLFFSHIKLLSENHFGYVFHGAVIGRPVNFMGAGISGLNEQALDIIRIAATRAGFDFIRFVMEPLAAALVISDMVFSSDSPVVVIDVGGGTTDVAYLGVDSSEEIKLEVRGISGERTGGNDFDHSIAIQKFKPHLGGSSPHGTPIVLDALSIRDIHAQSRFRKCGGRISELLKDNPGDVGVLRLFEMYRSQLQYRLLIVAEALKVGFRDASTCSKSIEFLPPEFSVSIDLDDVMDACQQHLDRIERNIQLAIPEGMSEVPVRVFLTGGMSSFLPIFYVAKKSLPIGSSFRRISALQSIVSGLAVVARQLSLSELEPKAVRGIPIYR